MIRILIDNKDIENEYDIKVLDYSELLGFAEIRDDELQWFDKSGVDPNLSNVRYNSREFAIRCLVKADDIYLAKTKVNVLLDYLFDKVNVVVSIRDIDNNIRECFLCKRSSVIVPSINIREQNSLYVFSLGLKDTNPNAIKYYNEIIGGETTIAYTKGEVANIYWGNGDIEVIENSANYTKSDYLEDDYVDIIIDTDKQVGEVASLIADFEADTPIAYKNNTIYFTDNSIGDISLWSWDFGDGGTSGEQNPSHTYTETGTYTVSLQIFNEVGGSSTETKVGYVTINPQMILLSSNKALLINSTDTLLLNN